MKLSDQMQSKLYTAIHEPIMQLRILRLRDGKSKVLDDQLFKLNAEIWEEVKTALNLPDHKPSEFIALSEGSK